VADATGETVAIQSSPPTIDPTSSRSGVTLDKNYLKNVPTATNMVTNAAPQATQARLPSAGPITASRTRPPP